jgi:hypothetical protein
MLGTNNFYIKAGIQKDTNTLNAIIYTAPDKVGILLGAKENGIVTPNKYSLVRILKIIAFNHQIRDVHIYIEQFDKLDLKSQ